jgi:hypothetical protein
VIAKISKTGSYRRPDTPDFKALSVWDIDDTLYTTPGIRILIKDPKTKEIIKTLTTAEYANHKKSKDFEYDFSQFTDPQYFYDNARKTTLFNRAIQEFRDKSNFFIILTARSNMSIKNKNDENAENKILREMIPQQRIKMEEEKAKEIFLRKFQKDGLQIQKNDPGAHVIRMGSLGAGYNKGKVITQILTEVAKSQTKIKSVKYWDDSLHEVTTMREAQRRFLNKVTFDITQV